MTLAALVDKLIKHDSVVHHERTPAPTKKPPKRRSFGRPMPGHEIAPFAERLGTFTRLELMTAAGCTVHCARHWIARNRGKLVEQSTLRYGLGGPSVVWRWTGSRSDTEKP